jgi:hypothetical protein
MKVICIKNKYGRGLELQYDVTIGKIYEVEDPGIELSGVKFLTLENDDVTTKMTYPSSLFITLEEHRQNQLDKLI